MSMRIFVTHTLAMIGLIAFFMLASCTTTAKHKSIAQRPKEDSSDLTRDEAQSRKQRLDQVTYTLHVRLAEKENAYSGSSEITFMLKDNATPLRLDFFEGRVTQLSINNQDVPVAQALKKYWVELPAANLKVGANVVKIDFSHDYSRQGQGLHKFTDYETKQVFLYSQFESFDANRFMPCFDQPDLRAVMTLTVDAPSSWQVISTTRETSIKPNQDANGEGRKIWTFPATPPIATYLFSLHAGPYQVWTDHYEDIPLRLFARPALAKYVHPKQWFTVTKQGLKFYNAYFGLKYPFKKYDQLIVPEFNAGAMENVGAVTFTEYVIPRSEPTRRQRRGLSSTLLHEMAHMWFGDIVTMAWWNDLWLNETFATYMSSLSLNQATEFKEAWQEFYAGSKGGAYRMDGLVTTHPIEADVKTVKEAETNFDAITYGKGASVMKQLSAYMGADNFQRGVRRYFKTHAYGNTTLNDFISALQLETKADLHDWAKRWLQQSGVDKLAAEWNCDGGLLKTIKITSTPMKPATFRPQAIQVALFSDESGKLNKPTVVPVTLDQPSTTVTGSWKCPAFVYPNYQDDGYARIALDPVSLKFAKENLSRISDPLLRNMVWMDLWQMVREAEMPLHDYIQVVDLHFPPEKNEMLLDQIVGTISSGGNEYASILNYWPNTTAQMRADRMAFVERTEKQYLQRFQNAQAVDERKFWFDNFVRVARTPNAQAQLATWAQQQDAAPGFTIDLDRRWNLVRQLARFNSPLAPKLLQELAAKDNSDRGMKNALAVNAVPANLAIKQKWVDTLKVTKPKVSLAEAWAVLGALFPIEQRDLAQRFKEDFYSYLKANGNSENTVFVTSFVSALTPLNCTAKDSATLSDFLQLHPEFSPAVVKQLKISIQEDERCQKIRAISHL